LGPKDVAVKSGLSNKRRTNNTELIFEVLNTKGGGRNSFANSLT